MADQKIKLGYAVGSGDEVAIPLRHMVVTGQTQEAGKTTTLEALIARSQLPAVAFVTKRGEQSFAAGRRTEPYFRERADWQFVASVLEATMREKLKFERAWIMRASKGASTLADVHRNVRRLMEKAKGMSADVYLTLDGYLDIVVPRVESIAFAERLDLDPGLNVVDLSDRKEFPPELQSLVMRSALEWVYEQCDGTITIIPEAWEFLPQGRGSPVKLAAVELIRKGAGLKNYVWLDSQDIGGVDKELLRQCPVWLLGVQREANEIKRTLDNIPASVARPKPADLATLERGQFFACWGRHVVKTYVQPDWIKDDVAREIATGARTVEDVFLFQRGRPKPTPPATVRKKEPPVSSDLDKKLDRILGALERSAVPPALTTATDRIPPSPPAIASNGHIDEESLFQRFRDRLMRDPVVLRILAERPTIELAIEVTKVAVDGSSLKGRVALLIQRDFFKSAKRHNEVVKELERTGPQVNSGNTATALKDFVKLGFLTNEETGYLAVAGMKVNLVKS